MSDFVLNDYNSENGDAAEINASAATIVAAQDGADETARLFESGVLTDSGSSSTSTSGSMTFAIAAEAAAAVDSLSLFDVAAEVVVVPVFYADTDDERLFVSVGPARLDRNGRHGASESRTIRISHYKRNEDNSANSAAQCVAKMEQLAAVFFNAVIKLENRTFVASEIEVDLIDAEQWNQNLIYAGGVDVTFVSGRC